MSNAVRFEASEIGFGLDAAAARRWFWLSLGVGLAVLAVAAMIGLQPTRAASSAPSARHGQISAPEFVVSPGGVAQRRPSATGAEGRSDRRGRRQFAPIICAGQPLGNSASKFGSRFF